jgi:hypothetical protein
MISRSGSRGRGVRLSPGSRLRRAIRRVTGLIAMVAVTTPALSASPSPDDGRASSGADRRMYAGLWTVHFRDFERGVDNNWAIGATARNVYAATFINSYGTRSFTGGYQDVLTRWNPRPASVGIGYRAGLVTGYDERFMALAGRSPVVPLLQPLLIVERGGVGIEFTYSGVVASAGFGVRF